MGDVIEIDRKVICNMCGWRGWDRRDCVVLDPEHPDDFDPACPMCEGVCIMEMETKHVD